MSYFLCINIGNSNINIAIFDGGGTVPLHTGCISSKYLRADEDILHSHIAAYLTGAKKAINGFSHDNCLAGICSVIKGGGNKISQLLKSHYNITATVIDPNIRDRQGNDNNDFPIALYTKTPAGVDRIINLYAAHCLYQDNEKSSPLLVIDFGTATTFDYLSNDQKFLGGIILPSARLMAKSLHDYTDGLPDISCNDIPHMQSLIGDATNTAISSGLYYGYLDMANGLIKRFCQENAQHPNFKIIATGGGIKFYEKGLYGVNIVDIDLTFKGISLYLTNILKIRG